MASNRPSSRYSAIGSRSSSELPSPSSSDLKHPSSRRYPSHAVAMDDNNSSRALVRARTGDVGPAKSKNTANTHTTFGAMVKKFMEKRSNNLKPGSADWVALPVPAGLITAAEETKKKGKASNLTSLHRKLFHKAGGGGTGSDGSARKALTEVKANTRKALTEVKANTRTLAMVLRSERELLAQNKEYEEEIQELRLLVEENNREVEKLKDLCLKQREEIKALKDAILFPDVMNSQLHELLEKQGSELKQARKMIPCLQKQVSSLTGQLQCLAEDLAEVKADKYSVRTCFEGHISSPLTPKSDQEAQNSLEISSGCPMTYGSPDEMFLKDLNPCLTPCFLKTKSKEYDRTLDYDSPNKDSSLQNSAEFSPDIFSRCRGGILSKSSEHCQQPAHGINTARKIDKSDESKWSIGKQKHQNLF